MASDAGGTRWLSRPRGLVPGRRRSCRDPRTSVHLDQHGRGGESALLDAGQQHLLESLETVDDGMYDTGTEDGQSVGHVVKRAVLTRALPIKESRALDRRLASCSTPPTPTPTTS